MKKFLALIVILLAILAALLELVLPQTVVNMLEERIESSTGAKEVDVSLSAKPNAKIALGEISRAHATADEVRIGDIDFKNLTVDGENISLDVPELLLPSKNLTAQERTNKILKHADKIELRGIITEDELKNYILLTENKIENPQVHITPEEVTASGRTKFIGRTIDVDIAGVFVVEDGKVLFRMTRLNSNSILSRVNLDIFLSSFKILDSSILPLGLMFDSIELRDGEAVVTAIRR